MSVHTQSYSNLFLNGGITNKTATRINQKETRQVCACISQLSLLWEREKEGAEGVDSRSMTQHRVCLLLAIFDESEEKNWNYFDAFRC
jgi:hypothetical protein